ncbi:MAG: CopG family transcriptional regulator [Chloroflexota bacterium]
MLNGSADNSIQIQTLIPNQLMTEAQKMVVGGLYHSFDELLLDALRRFLQSHRLEISEEFMLQDVEWGLHGQD